MKLSNYKSKIYIFSLLVPSLILSFIFIAFGTFPFGGNTILKADMYHQYLHFYSYFYDSIKGDSSLLYSWTSGLGTNFIGNLAYYISSPFMVVTLLFPKDNIVEAMTLTIILKIGFSGLTISFFIARKFPKMNSLEIVVFSTFYALMSYNIMFYHNLMWLDGLIWLPLIIISTERLIYSREVSFFIICLSISFLSNFYISFMVGLYTLLYFLSEIILQNKSISIKRKNKIYLKFIIGTVIAGGISSILTIPTFFQLIKTEKLANDLGFSPNINVISFLSKLLSGNYDSLFNGTPYIYIGTFVLILVPLFFLNSSIPLPEKVRWIALLVILFICMEFPLLNLIWHGFDSPNSFLYRYSFVFSFSLLIISLKAYEHLDEENNKGITYLFFITNLIVGLLSLRSGKLYIYVMNILSVSLFYLFIFMKLYIKNSKIFLGFLLILYTSVELLFNTSALYVKLTLDEGGNVHRNHLDDYKQYSDVIQKVKTIDSHPIFRIDTDLDYTLNDSIMLGHSSLNYFSSFLREDLADSMKSLGFSTIKAKYIENGATFFTNSLLGMKYKISSEKINDTGFYELSKIGDLRIYRNRYSIPIGILINKEQVERYKKSINPFFNQNEIFDIITEEELDLFSPIKPINVEYLNVEKKMYEDKVRLHREKDGEPIKIRYEFFIDGISEFYGQIKGSKLVNSTVFVNNKALSNYPSMENQGIIKFGVYQGEKVIIELQVDSDDFQVYEELFYLGTFKDFTDVYDNIANESFIIKNIEENKLEGNVNVSNEEKLLFLTIPWDEGWKVIIGDKRVKPKKTLGGFLGIPVTHGLNEIELCFIPRGLIAGIVVSIISLLILFYIIVYEIRKNTKRH